jgi:hypothetical protein
MQLLRATALSYPAVARLAPLAALLAFFGGLATSFAFLSADFLDLPGF